MNDSIAEVVAVPSAIPAMPISSVFPAGSPLDPREAMTKRL
jgi:hypothetical protein